MTAVVESDPRGPWISPVTGKSLASAMAPWLVGVLLSVLFWWPLWRGAGFVGGDVYNYFFPLKQHYAEGLRQGELRLWHPGIGNGIPVLGESQTGALYPPYLLAYRFLDLNTAYNAIFLFHYVLAYVFFHWFLRALGVGIFPSLLGAMVFVYGWFPPRACLDWAIVTGAWLPWALFALARWLQSGRMAWGVGLALGQCLQLLAGHFQLAFITVLAVLILAGTIPCPAATRGQRICRRGMAIVWLACGFSLAAPQLVSTRELQVRSQRVEETFADTVRYGNIPAAYFVQILLPFEIYPIAEQRLRDLGGQTNMIEAHLYFGMIPLLLLIGVAVAPKGWRAAWPWFLLLILGAMLAQGWPFAWLARLPGFSYFRYPGRYGILAQVGAAVLVALGADRIFPRFPISRNAALLAMFLATGADYLWVARTVQVVAMIRPPMISQMGESEVFARLTPTDRVLAMDGNTLALSGASTVPPYLGMGPAAYYSIWGGIPDLFHGNAAADPPVLDTLRDMGVTHLLTEKPLPAAWPATLAWSGVDAFLHPRWGRDPREPLYLYCFDRSLGRAYLRTKDARHAAPGTVDVRAMAAGRVELTATTQEPAQLVLTDLLYPGWSVWVDGKAARPVADPLFRVVELSPGRHDVRWEYRPTSLRVGLVISMLTAACMSLGCWWRRFSYARRSSHSRGVASALEADPQ